MQLLQVIGSQDLLPFAPPATVGPVYLLVYPVSIAVAVFQRFLAPLTKHAREDF